MKHNVPLLFFWKMGQKEIPYEEAGRKKHSMQNLAG